MKYAPLLLKLDPDCRNTAASIAQFAEDRGIFTGEKARQRIRVALGSLSRKEFPREGDGLVTLKGQSPTPAWYGWRWQQAVQTKDP